MRAKVIRDFYDLKTGLGCVPENTYHVGDVFEGTADRVNGLVERGFVEKIPRKRTTKATKRLLSLDADLVCVRPVSEIWDIPLDDCYFSAAHEWHRTRDSEVYTNAGVTLYNLRKMRDGKADELIAELNANVYPWLDQDVQNYRCQGHIQEMPSKFNSNWWTDKNADGAHIVHFAGVHRNQWINDPRVVRWRETPWDEVMWLHERHTSNR